MEAKFCIQTKGASFVFRRVGEKEEVRFKSLREAIKHARSLPQAKGTRLVMLSENGTAGITLQL